VTSSFDTLIDRSDTGCAKWSRYRDDVLPMWVADMDFASPPAIVDALRARLDHPVFGYAMPEPALVDAVRSYLRAKFNWIVEPEAIVFVPGVVPGFNVALGALLKPGDGVVVEQPVYPPIHKAAANWDLRRIDVPLDYTADGWRCDLDRFDTALADASALLLCSPQNPTGMAYSRDDLAHIAATCLANDVFILSDEIHCDLMLDGRRHVPIASLSEEIAARTITFMSASKTFNVAGLKAAFAVIPSADLRARFAAGTRGTVDSINAFGLAAALPAYRGDCAAWHDDLLGYLAANRDHLLARLSKEIPEIVTAKPSGLFLAWLDCSALGLEAPYRFFLEEAKVGFSPGSDFGADYGQFVRLNYGCPRALLDKGIDRMVAALARRAA